MTRDPVEIIRKYYAPYPEALSILLRHSDMVTRKAVEVAKKAPRLSPDMEFIKAAAMLHDIGIFLTDAPALGCRGDKPYICHGYLGREILEREGLVHHALVCERHVGVGLTTHDIRANGFPLPLREMVPLSIEEKIICYADKFFSKDGEPDREKPLTEVRESIGRYGEKKLKIFDEWHGLFEGVTPAY